MSHLWFTGASDRTEENRHEKRIARKLLAYLCFGSKRG
jgi:hypothetical protein